MKHILIAIALFVCLSAKSQLKPFSFGALVTGNTTSFRADPNIGSWEPKLGYGFSGFARLKIFILYAELEAGFSTHNFGSVQEIGGTNYTSNYKLSGIDVSGILGWRVIGIGPLGNFRLFAGYNLNHFSKITEEFNGNSVTNPSINNGNGSFLVGTGVDLWRVVFNLKYNIGLTDLSSLDAQTLKINSPTFSIGLRF